MVEDGDALASHVRLALLSQDEDVDDRVDDREEAARAEDGDVGEDVVVNDQTLTSPMSFPSNPMRTEECSRCGTLQ